MDDADRVQLRYVITGPFGAGKSAIAGELGRLGFEVAAEAARAVLAEQRASGGRGTFEQDRQLFFDLMLARAVRDHGAAHRLTVFDRGIVDLITYAEIFGLDPGPAEETAARHRYDDPVFVAPSWEEIYRTDDERHATFEQARAFGEAVGRAYERLGYTLVEVPRGSPAERAAFIRDRTTQR